jgi:hypothetical protein
MSVQRAVQRLRWSLLAVLAIAVVVLLLPAAAPATTCGGPCFTGGPSVRVTPDTQVEFKWDTNVSWLGLVEIFDNPDGTGAPIEAVPAIDGFGNPTITPQQDVIVSVVTPLLTNTTYYFEVIATDPSNNLPDVVAPTPLPSFFTGAQALSNVQVAAGTMTAQVSWQANVIGFGQVQYGLTPAYGEVPVEDAFNATDHSLTLTGLDPGTMYFFQACNLHAIDGDCLASSTGSFTTLPLISDQFLPPLAQSSDPTNPVVNTGKNGKVIPVEVQINQGATAITDQNTPGPVTIAVSKLATCSTTGGTDPVASYADAGQSSAGTNQFNYDPTIPAWVYNLDTKALGLITGNCYRIDVSVNGTQITNVFAVFKPTK